MPDTELEMARNGEFLREYGKQYFCVALEALNIGRIKWSMVPIGKKGQDELTFYMLLEDFRWLCKELVNGVAEKKIAADNAPYPTAYKYVTGQNGSKLLNIGGSNSPAMARINIQDKSKQPARNYTMAVSVKSLRNMAQKFFMNTVEYDKQVVAAFEAGRKERAKYKHALSSDDDVVSAPEEAPAPAKPVSNASSEPKPPVTKSKPTAQNDEYVLCVKGTKKETKDKSGKAYWSFQATRGQEKFTLLFSQDKVNELNWFADFEKAAQRPNGHELNQKRFIRDRQMNTLDSGQQNDFCQPESFFIRYSISLTDTFFS